jgi:hypothetical protein
MESLFQTKPVSNRSSTVKTAAASPGIESFAANAKAVSLATDDLVSVVVLLLQLTPKNGKMHNNMYKNLRISFFFCTFAAAKVKPINSYVIRSSNT